MFQLKCSRNIILEFSRHIIIIFKIFKLFLCYLLKFKIVNFLILFSINVGNNVCLLKNLDIENKIPHKLKIIRNYKILKI